MSYTSLAVSREQSRRRERSGGTLGGFSLVELLVSISIIAIIVTTIIIRQDSFNGAVLLRNQAYEVAFSVRDVQQSAVSIVNDSADIANFRSALGVEFVTGEQSYQLYRDADGDGFNSGDTVYAEGLLDPRFEIGEIVDPDSASASSISELNVVFERPNFDARFFDGSTNTEIPTSKITIEIRRVGTTGTGPGEVRLVEITSSGQIAVINAP